MERKLIAWERMELPRTTLKLLEFSKPNTENGHASVKSLFLDFNLHIVHPSVHRQVWNQFPLSKHNWPISLYENIH